MEQPIKKLKKLINLSKTNANLLLSLIEDILDASQLKNSKINLAVTEFSLTHFLQEIDDIIKNQAKLKNLNFSILNEVNNLLIVNDQRRLKQILLNFLTNAIKFTSFGSVTLQIRNSISGNLEFEVNDTGSGIPPEKINKLGSAYATFGTHTNQNQTGIGLGLHLSKQLIGMLGPEKKFYVESEVGKGTKFQFEIFQNIRNKDQQQEFYQQSQIYESSCNICEITLKDEFEQVIGGQYNIQTLTQLNSNNSQIKSDRKIKALIVDDNVFNIFVLKAQLKKIIQNLEIIQCYNGVEAVNNFEKFNNSADSAFTLIFMDCDMPIMDGYQATREITKMLQSGQFQDCKIIGNSALLTKSEEKECLAVGMHHVISKPVDQFLLEKLIIQILQQY